MDLVASSPCFQLKGGMFTLTTIQLINTNLEALAEQLTDKIKQAPKFFNYAPVVVDCQKVNGEANKLDFKHLAQVLRDHRLIPVGIRSANQEQQTSAIVAGLAVFSETTDLKSSPPPERAPQKNTPGGTLTRLITQPVRSGQQVYVAGADLIVTSHVSHGAELISEGHIHVYGPLRGRALAGVTGDTQARLFCQSLEAELISIAGHYLPSESLQASPHWKQAVCVSLEGDSLQITPL
jgi:septum site-determining protein MinC